MSVRVAMGLAITAGLALGVAPSGAAAKGGEQVIVVRTASGAVQADSAVTGLGGVRRGASPMPRYELKVPTTRLSEDLARLGSQPGVLSVSVARPVHAAGSVTPTNQCYVSGCSAFDEFGAAGVWKQDYLNTVGAPQAWGISLGQGVRVAVLDSGVWAGQPDLQGKIASLHNICAGDDPLCADTGQVASDDLGHGTHVAGILAADTSTAPGAQGVASLGWDVKVDVYKVLDSQGAGNTADVATAIYDAVAGGDRVISMSLANFSCAADSSDCGPDPDEQAAVEYALSHNVVVVAAAGNDGLDSPAFPASYPGVLSVAATDNSGAVQSFSQWGSAANIAAPGWQILSTWNDGPCGGHPGQVYCVISGTSMSTPMVSAAAALLIAHNPRASGPQVTELLESSARATRGGHPISGGLLDVPAALTAESRLPHQYNGYELAGTDGSVYPFGSVGAFGSLRGHRLTRPIVGIAMRSDGLGYWMDASDGGVFSFGQAHFYGSTGGIRLNRPVVGMAATPDGRGYWLVASDGGIFAFGDAHFYGSTGGIRLNQPVVGIAVTPDSRGYWLVATDGGIFSFGDARFHGSTGGITLSQPVNAMSSTPNGGGYWLFASDGGVFTFGNARFWGSAAGGAIPAPVVGAAN